jgi:hypothetical protein
MTAAVVLTLSPAAVAGCAGSSGEAHCPQFARLYSALSPGTTRAAAARTVAAIRDEVRIGRGLRVAHVFANEASESHVALFSVYATDVNQEAILRALDRRGLQLTRRTVGSFTCSTGRLTGSARAR